LRVTASRVPRDEEGRIRRAPSALARVPPTMEPLARIHEPVELLRVSVSATLLNLLTSLTVALLHRSVPRPAVLTSPISRTALSTAMRPVFVHSEGSSP